MVRHFMCDECDAIFSEEDAGSRPSVLEDGMRPWDRVMTCPVCGSDELRQLDHCELCGEPNTDALSKFCPDCQSVIDDAFRDAFAKVDNGQPDLIRIMFDRAEETGFYGSN